MFTAPSIDRDHRPSMTDVNTDEVVGTFEKMRRSKDYEYIMCKLSSDESSLSVDKVVKGSETTNKEVYQRFHEDVPADESRFIIYDFRFVVPGEIDHHKFILILWCPDGASTKEKNRYMSLKPALRKKLRSIGKELFIAHIDDLAYEEMKQMCDIH
ncbi:hypothetical protein LSAT2_015959 [Lamellibrachia satsuma]|nr:hypothetical protein LSAT2_015959 [Lamellibrachia satsuma]